MEQPQAIVFDLGGVLLDWNPRYLYERFFAGDLNAMERFLTEIGFEEWNLRQDQGRSYAIGVRELSARFPQYSELIQAYDDYWEESISGPIQASVDLLQSLKQEGHLLFALSNWSTEKFQRVRHQYAFLDCFETLVISGDVQVAKPDPRIFTLLLERIARRAEDCLYIDDLQTNIAVARQLGFQTIRFESAGQLEDELNRLGLLKRVELAPERATKESAANQTSGQS